VQSILTIGGVIDSETGFSEAINHKLRNLDVIFY
jgi:hypothetical protein